MFNLLPFEERKRLQKEYLLRILVLFFWGIFITGIIGLASLLPAYFLSKTKYRSVTEEHQSLTKILELKEKNDNLASLLKELEEETTVLGNKTSILLPTDIFQKIIGKKSNAISLGAFTYQIVPDKKDPNKKSLVVSGIAQTRESLVAFVDKLRGDSVFSRVDLPVSNLAKSSKINFSLTLEGSF